MDKSFVQELNPAGLALFSGTENFLQDLSQEEESTISGGKRSNSRSGRPRRRARRRLRRARRRPARSVSRT